MSEVFYSKKIECLFCKENFNTYRVRSNKSKFIRRDTDYCPYYEDNRFNPILYDVNVCPNCGFAFTDNFSPIIDTDLHNSIKESYIDRREGVPNLCKERDVDSAIFGYKLTLYCASFIKNNKLILANLALRTAWLYRYLNKEAEEKRFLKNVLDIYLEIYENEDLNSLLMDKYLLIYLIGEIYGRLGEYKKVTRWFSILIEDKNVSPQILKLTKDRWIDYRELMEMK